MAGMRVLVLILTAWITWFAIVNSARAARRPPPPPRAPPPPKPLEILASLDLNKPTYSTFITEIRNKVADKTEQCKIQKISKTLAQKYAYIELIGSSNRKVTLAIDMADLYVLGYSDMMNNKERAFFFKDVTEATQNNFFPGATEANRANLTFKGNYIDLENYATRENTHLGIFNLETSIDNIYGQPADAKKQAKFLLRTIQMVSEAARFKYISNKISEEYEVKVDNYIKALENGWGSVSTAVYNSNPSTTETGCKLARSPFKLDPWSFTTVEQIKDVVGLLKSS